MGISVGIIGLGVMGRNLALNARDSGFRVVATDSWETARDWAAPEIDVVDDAATMGAALPEPRVILLMVKAGDQVDVEVAALLPHLAAGDVIVDGGNSHYLDTARRAVELGRRQIGFVGLGVSGGAEGARNGPSMMAGSSDVVWALVEPILTAMAAKAAQFEGFVATVRGILCDITIGKNGEWIPELDESLLQALECCKSQRQ